MGESLAAAVNEGEGTVLLYDVGGEGGVCSLVANLPISVLSTLSYDTPDDASAIGVVAESVAVGIGEVGVVVGSDRRRWRTLGRKV